MKHILPKGRLCSHVCATCAYFGKSPKYGSIDWCYYNNYSTSASNSGCSAWK